jgi:hypothetical protein
MDRDFGGFSEHGDETCGTIKAGEFLCRVTREPLHRTVRYCCDQAAGSL